ncbi:carbon storage regulator [Legionella sp. CNM-4043-24]|uniref:carbon storage regulator n=1 Tax=Legionella sp. CNM-4043-24 TaxID=3421646 RepID=UPI00403A89F9
MDIVRLDFEEKLFITLNEQRVELIAYKTNEQGNIKFGIDAPRSMRVNRAEIQKKFIKAVKTS